MPGLHQASGAALGGFTTHEAALRGAGRAWGVGQRARDTRTCLEVMVRGPKEEEGELPKVGLCCLTIKWQNNIWFAY